MITHLISIKNIKVVTIHWETSDVERKVRYLSLENTDAERCDHSTGTMLNRHDHSPNSNKKKHNPRGLIVGGYQCTLSSGVRFMVIWCTISKSVSREKRCYPYSIYNSGLKTEVVKKSRKWGEICLFFSLTMRRLRTKFA